MKKLLIITFLAVPTLLFVGIGSLLVIANRAGENSQRPFFEAVASGNPDNVIAMLDQDVQSDLDAPVLAEWMKAVNERLGKYQGLSSTGFRTHFATVNGENTTTSSGTVLFERGEATSEIVYVDGKIVKFKIDSPLLDEKWFEGPSSSELYFDRAARFYQQFADKELDAAYESMHEALQDEVTPQSFAEMRTAVESIAGDIDQIAVVGAEFTDGDSQMLQVQLKLHGLNSDLNATADYQFVGLKGVLNGFHMSKSEDLLPTNG